MYDFYSRAWALHAYTPVEWDKNEPRESAFVTDKQLSIRTHKAYMLSRLLQMFEYKNLPETIPAEMLELQLLLNGSSFVTKVDGELYAVVGTPGGEPDPYYRPTLYVWANPVLGSRTDDLWKDGVLMRNDKLWLGLSPLMNKYASILAENEITLRVADIMLRIVAMITTPDDTTKVAGEEYLKRVVKGKLSVAAENRFFDGIKMQSPPSNNGSYLTQFIELQQYMKASFFNEVGMQANYNMKRENIGSGETAMNQNATLPLCDQMLAVRRQDLSRLNEMYGLDVSVDFTSAWKLNAEQLRLEVEQLKAELEATKAGSWMEGVGSAAVDSKGENRDGEDQGEGAVSHSDDVSEVGSNDSTSGERVSESDSGNERSSEVVDGEEGVSDDDADDGDGSDQDELEGGEDSSETGGDSGAEVNVTVVINNGDNNDVSQLTEGGDDDADVELHEGSSEVEDDIPTD